MLSETEVRSGSRQLSTLIHFIVRGRSGRQRLPRQTVRLPSRGWTGARSPLAHGRTTASGQVCPFPHASRKTKQRGGAGWLPLARNLPWPNELPRIRRRHLGKGVRRHVTADEVRQVVREVVVEDRVQLQVPELQAGAQAHVERRAGDLRLVAVRGFDLELLESTLVGAEAQRQP